MKVIVGSKNPVKLACSARAFSTVFPDENIEIEALETNSGVSEQPLDIEETIKGAVNRARNACRSDADFSVGIEGGLSFHEINGHEYGVEISWVCVYDCRTGVSEIASAQGFPVFPRVLKHIHDGEALSDAMAKEFEIDNIGQKNGYIGWLSNDIITRESSNYDALVLALSSLIKEERL
jgi:inosine/xanthosine triphosphatase